MKISNPINPRAQNGLKLKTLHLKALHWFFCGLTLLALQSANGAPRIGNLSTRARVGTGNNVVIAGIIVSGTGTATLVFRGIGPSLAPSFPVGTVLLNPYLQLYNSSGAQINFNDNWQQSPQQAQISAVGLAPSNSNESAIMMSLAAGNYSVVLSGVSNGTGMALVEIYDITPQPAANYIRMANISTRARAENSYAQEILGMILQGSGTKNVLIRGLGPSIPLAGTLPNPFLSLSTSSGGFLGANDNWRSSQEAQIIATGAAPTNDLESAMIVSLAPGAYAASLQDLSGTAGIALAEMYDLDPRLLWIDSSGGNALVGPPSNLGALSPTFSGPGTITVHFTGHAHGTCQGGCFPPGSNHPNSAQLWPELYNSQGTTVAQGAHLVFPYSPIDALVSQTDHISWTAQGPVYLRMRATSNATSPNQDSVTCTYYDIYAP